MGIAGPRLDRPSAIGDEGRPRAASLTVAAVLVTAVVLAVALLQGATGVVTFVALAVTLLVTGMALLQRQRLRSLFGGHLCLHTGLLLLLAMATFTAIRGQGVVATGIAFALLGIATAWTDTLDEDAFSRALSQGGRSYVGAFALTLVGTFVVGFGFAAVFVLETLTATRNVLLSVLAFFAVLGTVCLAVLLAMRQLPLVEMVAEPGATETERRIERVQRVVRRFAVGSGLAFVVVLLLIPTGMFQTLERTVPGFETLAVGLSSVFVIVPLAVVGALAIVAAVLAEQVTTVADAVDAGNSETLAQWAAAVVLVAGFCFLLFVPTASPVLALVAAVGQPLALVTVLWVPMAVAAGYMARQSAGPAVSAAGLVVLAIGASGGVPAPVVFACIVAAVVVWDLATFGTSLTVELGHIPETRRLELYHAVLSLGVGVGVVAVLSGVDAARRALGSGEGALPGAVVALCGVVLLVIVEWGR